MLQFLKSTIEKAFAFKIYRNSIPRGTDLFFDLDKAYRLNSFRTVFDVGANVGQSAQEYIQQFPKAKIYSFEPATLPFKQLQEINKKYTRLSSFQLGMGKKKGKISININPNSLTNSIRNKRPEDKVEEIEITSIDTFCQEYNIDKIDFLKIDTEGYDLEVLEGANTFLADQKINIVMLECEPVAFSNYFTSFTNIAHKLYDLEYELFGIYQQQPYWDGRNSILYFNAVFISKSLISKNSSLQ